MIAFFSLLRRSNLFRSPHNVKYLRVADVEVTTARLLIRVAQLKTDRFAESHFHLTVDALPGSSLCPVAAVRDLLAFTKHKHSTDPLFSYEDINGRQRYLDPNLFTRFLREVLSSTGMNTALFSIHSFRRGAATFASSIGVGREHIKAQGHWKSSCFQQYIARDDALRVEFSTAVSASFPGSFGSFRRSATGLNH